MSKFLDVPLQDEALTDYDREHMKLYLRLIDASRDGADWREAFSIVFGIDPDTDPARYQRMHHAHLARARWMSDCGFRLLAGEKQPPARG